MPGGRRLTTTSLLVGVTAAALATAPLVAAPATAATGCSVKYTVTAAWGGGFVANVDVTNLGDAVNGWSLTWSFAAGQTVSSGWNAAITQSGGAVTASNVAYNTGLATNGTASFGFQGVTSGTDNPVPGSFALNGTTCTGSTGGGTSTSSSSTSSTTTTTTTTSSTTTSSTTTSSTTTTTATTTTTTTRPTTTTTTTSTGNNAGNGTLVTPGGKCLGTSGTGNGSAAQIQSCNGSSTQSWQFASDGTLRTTGGSMCLDANARGTANGTTLIIWSCHGEANQRFSQGSNSSIVNAGSGRCVDVPNGSTTDGTQVQLYDCWGGDPQKWTYNGSGNQQPTTTTTSSRPTTTTTTSTRPTTTTTTTGSGGAIYAAPGGSAGSAGTISSPTTVADAVTRVAPGGTVYLRGGTYNLSSTINIAVGNNGTSNARKTLTAYPGERPVLNFSAMSESDSNRGLAVNGNYWHISGITVQRAGDNGIFIGGSYNVIERVVTAYNRDSGLQISRASSSTPRSAWPSYNLVISSESHDNADSDGEDADGFAAKLTSGPGNVFRYTVAHHNIDDGWDLYAKNDTGAIDPVTIEDSLAYSNGTLSNGTVNANGDRNGYKLGGSDIPVNHVVKRSIAYKNGKHGFTYNSNPGSITVASNLSVDNATRNYSFDQGSHVYTGNTSCRFSGGGSNDKTVGTIGSNNQFWTGSNGSRCGNYSGSLSWSFASDGRLVVTLGGRTVSLS